MTTGRRLLIKWDHMSAAEMRLVTLAMRGWVSDGCQPW